MNILNNIHFTGHLIKYSVSVSLFLGLVNDLKVYNHTDVTRFSREPTLKTQVQVWNLFDGYFENYR